MEKKLTPMQSIIARMEREKHYANSIGSEAIEMALTMIRGALPLERQEIESAFNRGWFEYGGHGINSQTYFQQTYKTE